jgi:hypothetical protein
LLLLVPAHARRADRADHPAAADERARAGFGRMRPDGRVAQ